MQVSKEQGATSKKPSVFRENAEMWKKINERLGQEYLPIQYIEEYWLQEKKGYEEIKVKVGNKYYCIPAATLMGVLSHLKHIDSTYKALPLKAPKIERKLREGDPTKVTIPTPVIVGKIALDAKKKTTKKRKRQTFPQTTNRK